MSKIESKTDEYKGYPTVAILKDDERIFSGGVKKCKAILDILAHPEAIDAIKEFVKANTTSDSDEANDK